MAPLADLIDTVTATVGDPPSWSPSSRCSRSTARISLRRNRSASTQQAFAGGGGRPTAEHRPRPVFLPAPLDPLPGDDEVSLDDLVELHRSSHHRVSAASAWGCGCPRNPSGVAEELPVAVDGLAKWTIGDRMLAAVLAAAAGGDDLEDGDRRRVRQNCGAAPCRPGRRAPIIAADIASAAAVIARVAGRDTAGHASSTPWT